MVLIFGYAEIALDLETWRAGGRTLGQRLNPQQARATPALAEAAPAAPARAGHCRVDSSGT